MKEGFISLSRRMSTSDVIVFLASRLRSWSSTSSALLIWVKIDGNLLFTKPFETCGYSTNEQFRNHEQGFNISFKCYDVSSRSFASNTSFFKVTISTFHFFRPIMLFWFPLELTFRWNCHIRVNLTSVNRFNEPLNIYQLRLEFFCIRTVAFDSRPHHTLWFYSYMTATIWVNLLWVGD